MRAEQDMGPGGEGAPPAAGQALLFRPFVWAALISTLTLGTVFGAASLIVIHGGRGASWVNPSAHATAQLFGFVFLLAAGLIVAGGSSAGTRARAARFVWGLAAAGVLARATSQFLTAGPWAVWLGVGGALGLSAAAVLFAKLAGSGRQGSGPAPAGRGWLTFGSWAWVASALLLLAGAIDAARLKEAFAAAAWNEAAYRLGLFGGALFWMVGLLERFGPELPGMRPRAFRQVALSRKVAVLAVALLATGAILEDRLDFQWAPFLSLAGWGLLALAAGWISVGLGSGLLRPGGSGDQDAGTLRLLQCALASLALFAALTVALVVLELRGASNHLVVDSARHAFSIGFVMLLLFTLACRILPSRSGIPLAWPESRGLAGGLLAATVVLRSLEIGAGLGATRLLMLSGSSGVLASFGVGVFAVCLAPTLVRRRPR